MSNLYHDGQEVTVIDAKGVRGRGVMRDTGGIFVQCEVMFEHTDLDGDPTRAGYEWPFRRDETSQFGLRIEPHPFTEEAPVSGGDPRDAEIAGTIRQRGDEWVLELTGAINDCYFESRHTEPLTTAREDVAGLPSLYAEIARLHGLLKRAQPYIVPLSSWSDTAVDEAKALADDIAAVLSPDPVEADLIVRALSTPSPRVSAEEIAAQAAGLGYCQASHGAKDRDKQREVCTEACGYCMEEAAKHPHLARLSPAQEGEGQ